MIHCSNALKTKRPGKPGPFYFLVEAAGIEPASENEPIEASTCLSCVLISSVKTPTGRVHSPTSPFVLAPLPRAGEGRPAHLYDALPCPVSEAREAWWLVLEAAANSTLALCFFPPFFHCC